MSKHRMAKGRSSVYDVALRAHSPIVRVRPRWQRILITTFEILEMMLK